LQNNAVSVRPQPKESGKTSLQISQERFAKVGALAEFQHASVVLPSGVRLHYVELGPTTGPPVLLLHGWPEFWYGWRKQMPVLANAGFRAIAVDMRGFGQTEVPAPLRLQPAAYTFKAMCEDLSQLLDIVHLDKAVFVGHDWGGMVVWRLARYLPNRVQAVASVCTAYRPRTKKFVSPAEIAHKHPRLAYQIWFSEHPEEAARELDQDIDRSLAFIFRSSSREDHVGHFMRPGDKGFLQHFPKNYTRSKLFSDEEWREYAEDRRRRGFRESLVWYSTTRLNWEDEKDLPVVVWQRALMVTAGKDAVLSPAITVGMEDWVPHLRRAHIHEAAHWVASERGEELSAILLSWLQHPQDGAYAPLVHHPPSPFARL